MTRTGPSFITLSASEQTLTPFLINVSHGANPVERGLEHTVHLLIQKKQRICLSLRHDLSTTVTCTVC